MRLLQSPNADMKALSIVAPIVKGGTGADNSTEAVENLGGLNAAFLGQPNGVAKLNAQGKLDLTAFPNMVTVGPTLNGPATIFTGQTVQYTITNYDINTTYNVSVSTGSITRSGDTLTYTASGVTGTAVLTVNNKVANITVQNTAPIAPTITSPVNGSTGIMSGVLVTASPFAMNNDSDTHAASDWQAATDNEFNNVISSSINDTINKTSWTATGLSENTTYYLRVRYKGTIYGYGAWSNAITFTTRSSFIPIFEQAILTASDKATNNYFGFSVDIDSSGTRIIVGAYGASVNGFTSAGKAYIFVRSGTTWTQEAVLTASDTVANTYSFGFCVSIDSTGTRTVVGAIYAKAGTVGNAGQAYVFSRSGTTWTEEAKLSEGANAAAWASFGEAIDISSDGVRIVVGAKTASPSGQSSAGRAYVFSRSGTTWTQEAVLTASDIAANGYFGKGVSITNDGSRLVIGARGAAPSGLTLAGQAYVFSRSGTTWTQEAILTAGDKATNDNFGDSLSIDGAGNRIVVGANMASRNSATSIGKAYIFSRSGTTWTQETDLSASDGVANDKFGQCEIAKTSSFALVSAPAASNPGYSASGKVYIYKKTNSVWSQFSIMTASDKASSDYYGKIAISGDESFIIAGSYQADPGGISAAGKVYIYA
jgi:hypothetical protein